MGSGIDNKVLAGIFLGAKRQKGYGFIFLGIKLGLIKMVICPCLPTGSTLIFHTTFDSILQRTLFVSMKPIGNGIFF